MHIFIFCCEHVSTNSFLGTRLESNLKAACIRLMIRSVIRSLLNFMLFIQNKLNLSVFTSESEMFCLNIRFCNYENYD